MESSGENSQRKLSRRAFLKELGGAAATLVFTGCGTAATRETEQKPGPPQQPPFVPETKIEFDEVKEGSTTFIFGKDVAGRQRKEIQDAVTKARDWFSSHGINLENTSILAFNDPKLTVDFFLQRTSIPQQEHERTRQNLSRATAFVGKNKDLFIITGSPGWTRASPIIGGPALEGRYHTVAHELFHVWQTDVGAYKREPVAWMNEGIAHYVAALFLRDAKIYDYGLIRNGHLGEAGKVKEPLSTLESGNTFYRAGNPQTADEYSLAFLAVEFLTRDLSNSGIPAITDYWKKIGQGLSHQNAFEGAFGQPPTAFYQKFEAYRAGGFIVRGLLRSRLMGMMG